MTGLAASVRVLLWKNWRVKQRESRLNRNRTAHGQWLFPALLMDIVLPLTLLLLFVMLLCKDNALGVNFGDVDTPVLRANAVPSSSDNNDNLRLMHMAAAMHTEHQGNASTHVAALERKNRALAAIAMQRTPHVSSVSSALFMSALPLLLQQTNQSLAVLDRGHARAFLQSLDREHRGCSELGIPSFRNVTQWIPFDEASMTTQQIDELLRAFPATSGRIIYASLDVRPIGTDYDALALELVMLLHRRVSPPERTSTDQMGRYFFVDVIENRRYLRLPGALPLQAEANRFVVHTDTNDVNNGDDDAITEPFPAPAVVCSALQTMLRLGQLEWRDLATTSPLGLSVHDCEIAARDSGRRLSQPLKRFLTHLVHQQRRRDALHTLQVASLPKRPQSTAAGQLETLIVFFLTYVFLWPFVRLVRDVVMEKEVQLKEYLLIMGVEPMALLLSWYALYLGACVVLSAIAATLLSGALFAATAASALYFFVLLVTFASSILLFGLAITPVFNQAKTAAATASLAYFVLGAGPFIRALVGDDVMADSAVLDAVVTYLETVSSPVAFMAALHDVAALDAATGAVRPIAWSTVRGPCVTMAIQSAGYLLLGWYLENVFPRPIGVQRRWYFVLQPSYWCPTWWAARRSRSISNSAIERAELLAVGRNDSDGDNDDATVREMPLRDFVTQFDPVLVVRALAKRYANGTLALRGVSFAVKRGEIFGLLGPNGAGKSTTLGILSGMLAPTSGDAVVGGTTSVARDPDAVRRSLSVCFQQNLLFDDLSVDEHVQLVCALKRALGVQTLASDAVAATLQQFGLHSKRDALAKTLSGGQKRKLSLVLALLDNARVVLLDEPTAGMDLKARLDTWDALRRAVRHRAVILTTHSMHEAEALCENIGIVADGELRCCGSSLFLRERYGVGYKLTLVHPDDGNGASDSANRVDTATLLRTVRAHVPAAAIVSDNKWETRLALTDGDERRFTALFRKLDELRAQHTLKRYAIAATDLEDVFVKVTDGDAVYNSAKDDLVAAASVGNETREEDTAIGSYGETHSTTLSRSSASSAMRTRLRALVIKRVKVALRDRKQLLAQYVWPIVIFAVLLVAAQRMTLDDQSIETLTQLPHAAAASSVLLLASSPELAPRVRELLPHVQPRAEFRAAASTQDMLDAVLRNDTATPFFAAAYITSFDTSLSADAGATFALFYNQSVARSLPVALQQLAQASCCISGTSARSCKLSVRAGTLAFQHSENWSTAIDMAEDDPADPIPAAAASTPEPTIDIVNRAMLAIYLLFTLSSIVAYYAAPVVKERESGLKRQQYLHLATRAAARLYWTAHFVFDFAAYLLAAAALVAVIAALSTSVSRDVLTAWTLGLVLFGAAVLPFTYALSLLFASHSSAQSFMSYASLFQLVAGIVSMYLATSPTMCVKAHAAAYVLQLLPLYSLMMLMSNVAMLPLASTHPQCLRAADLTSSSSSAAPDAVASLLFAALGDNEPSVWDWTVSGCYFAALAGSALLFAMLLLVCDHVQMYPALTIHTLRGTVDRTVHALGRASTASDYSAVALDARDLESAKRGDLVDVENVTKVFNAKRKPSTALDAADTDADADRAAAMSADGQVVALNGVSFSVERGDCVALLGVNGSGKSTMFEILTGGTAPTSGRARIAHCDVTLAPQRAAAQFGYCPQTNVVFADLTVREHLELFYRLRAAASHADGERAAVNALLTRLDLVPVANTAAAHLSGGNKRRLMLALALLRDSAPLLLLDEPSAGVDVVARRLMWRVLRARQRTGCLFTTHSMEEAEAVCANAVVLFKGDVVWSGSIPELKQHAARGVAISLRLDSAVVLAPARVAAYATAVRDLLAAAPTSDATTPATHIRCNDLKRVWTMCRERYRPVATTTNDTSAFIAGNDNSRTDAQENRARREDWLASVVARTREQHSSDSDSIPSVSVDAFVREWLIQEDLATLEHALFAEHVTAHSGERVVAVAVQSAGGSGSNTAAAYETNCTDAFGLAALFDVLETHKARFAIAQYSISELSLERVFEQFT